jgi:uncharacterized membrane protein HdeD (DUF308 family)
MEASAAAAPAPAPGRPWWLLLIDGFALAIIGGVMLWGTMEARVETYHLIVVFLGLWWVIRGIMDIVSMFVDHSQWGWKLFIGIVSIIAGGYILAYPIVSGLVIPRVFVFVLGFWGLVNGIVLLIMAFRGGGWGAGILGVLEIIIGVVLMANSDTLGMGLSFLWVASWFAVIGGIVMIVRAFQARSAGKAT